MKEDAARWDARYEASGCFHGAAPSLFLVDNLPLIKSLAPGPLALDIACGEGRNSIFLAQHGFTVTGIDISGRGITKARQRMEEEGLVIDFRVADLEKYTFAEQYDQIINFNFLLRELIPPMVSSLTTGGIILFDTILDAPSCGTVHNRDYLLQPGELLRIFSGFDGTILKSEEHPEKDAPTAKLMFRKQ